jgi:hypothetical protein
MKFLIVYTISLDTKVFLLDVEDTEVIEQVKLCHNKMANADSFTYDEQQAFDKLMELIEGVMPVFSNCKGHPITDIRSIECLEPVTIVVTGIID